MKPYSDNESLLMIQMKNSKFQLTTSICKQFVKLQNAISNCILKAENIISNKYFTFVYSFLFSFNSLWYRFYPYIIKSTYLAIFLNLKLWPKD